MPRDPVATVRKHIQRKGLTERAFARAVGIDHSALNRILRGERAMGELIAMKIERSTGLRLLPAPKAAA